jgi:hypothetical protein
VVVVVEAGGGTAAARPTSHVTAESDSSALTMESGDESEVVAPTPKGSVNTGTDAGTDYGEDEDVEVTASPGTFYTDESLSFLLSCAEFLSFFLCPQRHLRRRRREEVVEGAEGAEERAREGEAQIRLEE